MRRFLFSNSGLKSYANCPQSFYLSQTGAERGPTPSNLTFGTAAHRVMELYVDHCVNTNRRSDITIVPAFIRQAVTETKLSLTYFDELSLLLTEFVAVYEIDVEHSLAREGGIAFDENLNVIPWSDSYEYDNLSKPIEQKGQAVWRTKLDHVLLYPEDKRLKIEDYKSDQFVPSQTEILKPSSRFYQQARDYAWAAFRGLYPAEVIEVEFLFMRWIRFGKIMKRTIVFTPSDVFSTEELLESKMTHIEAAQLFMPVSGDHCSMCNFRTTSCPIKNRIELRDPEDIMRKYLYEQVNQEERREILKAHVAEYGFDGAFGMLRAEFVDSDKLVPDMRRVWQELKDVGFEEPWAVMNLSKTDAKTVLDKDVYERVIAKAYDKDITVRFNVHQRKDALVALAQEMGIDTTKKTVAQLAWDLAQAASETPVEVSIEEYV